MTTLATLVIEVDTDTSSAMSGLRNLGSSAGSSLGGMARTVGKGVAIGTGIAAAGLGALGVMAVKGAVEAEMVAAQTSAALESTGGAANVTAGQIASLATEIQNYSGMSDEAIQSGENLLLTFTNIRNEVGADNDIFDQTTRIMADMSVALGQDMSSSAMQLGKALNDPIKGITALQRVGVAFTDQTRDRITALVEEGNTMEAQKIILGELAKEFGGSAEAMGKTAQGQFNILKETVGNALEEVGGSILDVAQTVLPILSGAFTEIMKAVAPAIETLFQALAPVISQLVEALAPVLPKIVQAFADLLIALLPLIPPLGELLAAVAPLLPLLVDLLVTVLEPIIPVLVKLIEMIAGVVAAFVSWVEETQILHTIGEVIATVVETAIGIVEGFIGFIGEAWATIRDVTMTVWHAIQGGVLGVWDAIKAAAQTVWNAIKAFIIDPVREIKDMVVDAFRGMKEILSDVWGAITGAAKAAWEGMVSFAKAGLNGLIMVLNALIRAVNTAAEGLANVLSLGVANVPDIPTIPHLARGGLISQAGLAVVGERGPELLSLPRGAEVMPRVPAGLAGISPVIEIHLHGDAANLIDRVDEGLARKGRSNVRLVHH